ncbi:MAG: type VI secretion system tube protein Hcp [Deltaproteobacteria bacterium]|nr:type VI secretion system tube protein Hcp [Deltaproteobacteria bacterium]
MKRMLLASLGLLWLAAGSAQGADYFLKIEGIEGESIGSQGQDGVSVASWSLGASNPTSVGSSGMSQGRMAAAPAAAEPAQGSSGTATVVKKYDKASPLLAKKCAQGEHIKSAQLTRCQDGQCRVAELENVMVSSYSVTHDGGQATESVTLRYHRWRWADAAMSESTTLRESPTRQSLKGGGASVGKPNPGK